MRYFIYKNDKWANDSYYRVLLVKAGGIWFFSEKGGHDIEKMKMEPVAPELYNSDSTLEEVARALTEKSGYTYIGLIE